MYRKNGRIYSCGIIKQETPDQEEKSGPGLNTPYAKKLIAEVARREEQELDAAVGLTGRCRELKADIMQTLRWKGGMTARGLARELNVTLPAVRELCEALTKRGYLRKTKAERHAFYQI